MFNRGIVWSVQGFLPVQGFLHCYQNQIIYFILDCSAKCKAEKKRIDLNDVIDQALYQRSFTSLQEGHLG